MRPTNAWSVDVWPVNVLHMMGDIFPGCRVLISGRSILIMAHAFSQVFWWLHKQATQQQKQLKFAVKSSASKLGWETSRVGCSILILIPHIITVGVHLTSFFRNNIQWDCHALPGKTKKHLCILKEAKASLWAEGTSQVVNCNHNKAVSSYRIFWSMTCHVPTPLLRCLYRFPIHLKRLEVIKGGVAPRRWLPLWQMPWLWR